MGDIGAAAVGETAGRESCPGRLAAHLSVFPPDSSLEGRTQPLSQPGVFPSTMPDPCQILVTPGPWPAMRLMLTTLLDMELASLGF